MSWFIVGSCDYGSHTANLWINPSSATFRSTNVPAAIIIATKGAGFEYQRHSRLRARLPHQMRRQVVIWMNCVLARTGRWSPGDWTFSVQPAEPDAQRRNNRSLHRHCATGNSPFTYQWQKSGVALTNNAKISGRKRRHPLHQ